MRPTYMLSPKIEELLTELQKEHPNRGFLLAYLGEVEGGEQLITYSNMDETEINYVASALAHPNDEFDDFDDLPGPGDKVH